MNQIVRMCMTERPGNVYNIHQHHPDIIRRHVGQSRQVSQIHPFDVTKHIHACSHVVEVELVITVVIFRKTQLDPLGLELGGLEWQVL